MISQRDLTKGKVLVSACAIIEGKDHEVLLMYEGDMPYHEWWVLPGGYVRPEETVEQAVAREVKEETGLEVASTRFMGLYEDFYFEKEEPINHIIIAYKVEIVGGRIIFSKEATAYKWLTVKEALSSPEVPKVFKEIVKDAEKLQKKRFSFRETS
jgi:ADP-ribose pyrophosphatase YjhB (NUDIX family)